MYKVDWKKEIPLLVLIGALFMVHLFFYAKLPDTLPVHWNVQGQVDNWMPKNYWTALMSSYITLGMYLLMLFFPYIDPRKERYEKFAGVYRILRIALVVFMVLMSSVVLLVQLGIPVSLEKVIPAAVAVVLLVRGNYMGKIKSNWFVGVRLPWTLSDEVVWNKTNRLGGKLMMAVGVVTLIGLLFSPLVCYVSMMISIVAMIVVLIVYSIREFEKRKKQQS